MDNKKGAEDLEDMVDDEEGQGGGIHEYDESVNLDEFAFSKYEEKNAMLNLAIDTNDIQAILALT